MKMKKVPSSAGARAAYEGPFAALLWCARSTSRASRVCRARLGARATANPRQNAAGKRTYPAPTAPSTAGGLPPTARVRESISDGHNTGALPFNIERAPPPPHARRLLFSLHLDTPHATHHYPSQSSIQSQLTAFVLQSTEHTHITFCKPSSHTPKCLPKLRRPRTTGGKAPAGKAPAEKKEAGKKTAAPSGEKKKRTKSRKETYSSYIYKGRVLTPVCLPESESGQASA